MASAYTIKRIIKDIQEFLTGDTVGISISPLDDDIFKLHANIIVLDGPYKDNIMHLDIRLPTTYPNSSPAAGMAPGFPFTHVDHEHVYGSGICSDVTSNFDNYFRHVDKGRNVSGSGWSGSMTLKSLLLVLQQFFVNPEYNISPEHAKKVSKNIKNFKCTCGHTSANPNPEFPILKSNTTELVTNTIKSNIINVNKKKNSNKVKRQKLIQRANYFLQCSFTKDSLLNKRGYIKNKKIRFGYPILLNIDRRNRLWLDFIPEILTYEPYALEIQKAGDHKLNNFIKCKFRTSSGQLYNNWLPIYINENHYLNNKQYIFNAISVISNGIEGTPQNDFSPEMVIRVIPALINKMAVSIMKDDLYASENAIIAYCHYVRLFLRLMANFKQLWYVIESKLRRFLEIPYHRHKKQTPNLGELLFLLMAYYMVPPEISNRTINITENMHPDNYYSPLDILQKPLNDRRKLYSYTNPDFKESILKEHFTRQVFWINKSYPEIHKYNNVHNEAQRQKYLTTIFEVSDVSNKLFVFNLMAAKFFFRKNIEKYLDDRYGIPSSVMINELQQNIKTIKQIKNVDILLNNLQFDTKTNLVEYFKDCLKLSNKHGYTKIEIPI